MKLGFWKFKVTAGIGYCLSLLDRLINLVDID
jgi:hypothetical protein